jgi:hypothetical protein
MDYVVTCNGSPIGVADLASLSGLAHAVMQPAAGYVAIRDHARQAAAQLGVGRRLWTAVQGDFAEEFARTWGGGRLAIVDGLGDEVAVASVIVIDSAEPEMAPRPRVVVDARPDMARVEALLSTTDGDDGGRSRPTA